MNVDDFQTWGDQLEKDQRVCVAVMLGIHFQLTHRSTFDRTKVVSAVQHEIRRKHAWSGEPVTLRARFGGLVVDELIEQGIAAKYVLECWPDVQQLIGLRRVRVEIQEQNSPETALLVQWIATQFSCYNRADRKRVPISWRWPLRLGFLTNEPSQNLMNSCRGTIAVDHPWAARLSTIEMISPAYADCDVLVVPFIEGVVDDLLSGRFGLINADVSVFLDHDASRFYDFHAYLPRLRNKILGSAIGWQPISGSDEQFISRSVEFAVNLVRGVSHSWPFDFVFYEAAINRSPQGEPGLSPVAPPGYLISSRRFLNNSDLAKRLRNCKELFERSSSIEFEVPINSRTRDFVASFGTTYLGDLARGIPDIPNLGDFVRESERATAIVDAVRDTADGVHAAERPRYIQARVKRVDNEGQKRDVKYSFVVGQAHQLEVCIGCKLDAWLSPDGTEPFPEESLPASLDEYELTIAVIVLEPPFKSRSGRVKLPRRGSSGTFSFDFVPVNETGRLTLRVIVAFRNRILQSALLRGRVSEQDVSDGEPIRLTIEALTLDQFDLLFRRSRFESAILVNHTPGGIEGITTLVGDRICFNPANDLITIQRRIEGELSKIAYSPDQYETIFTNDSQELLWKLAHWGRKLYKSLREMATRAFGDRIQVSCVEADRRLPLEFCYNDELPDDDAEVCPHASQSLIDGLCAQLCPKGSDRKRVICPLSFWATSKVIERHLFDQQKAALMLRQVEMRWSNSSARRGISVFNRILCGVSQIVTNADEQHLLRIEKNLKGPQNTDLTIVSEWPSWKQSVSLQPTLLIAIGHMEDDPELEPLRRIEIGFESWLRSDAWEGYIRTKDTPPPIIFLFGCEADKATIPTMDFISDIRQAGAGIIVTTNSTIHAVHAVDLLERMIPLLRRTCAQQGTFGEVLRDVRRITLADGSPMPLCVMAFGDADWLLLEPSQTGEQESGTAPIEDPGSAGQVIGPLTNATHDSTSSSEAQSEIEDAQEKELVPAY